VSCISATATCSARRACSRQECRSGQTTRSCARRCSTVYRNALDVPRDELPTKDEAWLRYRACAAYGLAIWLSTLGNDGWQSREVCEDRARRYGAAFVELESTAALDRVSQ